MVKDVVCLQVFLSITLPTCFLILYPHFFFHILDMLIFVVVNVSKQFSFDNTSPYSGRVNK